MASFSLVAGAHLEAGAAIHGWIGESARHLVVGAHMVRPVSHTELSPSVRVERQESRVLGRTIVTELAGDEGFQLGPLVVARSS
jgi:hypothetical protein